MDSKESKKDSLDIAGRIYDVSDYKRKDTLSYGLAKTHEQVSDTYTEGEMQSIVDDVDGKNIEIKGEEAEEESQ
ncbi:MULTISPECIES: YozQ family protein [unclassified Peribacillus]|uniref:YozQ family protein n=1 Tax=unclassified Peribacillus TaxID=2675266 RepID=UPI001912C67B|nr:MULTISPECIES: YozQ family protein [unclassified Peribacillus]MBK5446570.1 YozQ family protein [Peribacillus sp. TH24]MBK5458709.1 YozQ family protein [Peribacillus sp. TH27]MBK5502122.1 YozQ family protein [Peribacillus sp. TH14]WMX57898.1 YozQ family protein [Peribacillus sp. R9-11]